jgi:hypothetical protein
VSAAQAVAGRAKDQPGDPGTLIFENDRVRVWELIMKPGEICNWHVHEHDHLLVVLMGCDVRALRADGQAGAVAIPDRTVLFIPGDPTPEIARNDSADKTLRELIIEFKDPKSAPTGVGQFGFFQSGTPTTTFPGDF